MRSRKYNNRGRSRPALADSFSSLRSILSTALIVLGIAASFFAAQLDTDNSIERWLNPDDPATVDYERFRQTFGADEFIAAVISGKPLFDPEALDAMLAAQTAFESIPGVLRVKGIPAVYRDRFGAEDPEALEEEFTSTPFYTNLFLSEDRRTAGLFLELDPPRDSGARRALVQSVDRAAQPLRDYGYRVDLVGPPVLNVTLDTVAEGETMRLMPIALAVSLLILAALLRSFRATFVAVVCGWLSVAIPLGLIAALGYKLSMVSSILPPLLWVLSLSHTIHILTRFRHHRGIGAEPMDAMALALRETTLPCTLAAFTTAAGFLSLTVSPMPPIRETGVFAAIGLILALVVNLTVAPFIATRIRIPSRPRARSLWRPVLDAAANAAIRRPLAINLVFALIMLAGLASLTRIRPEPNPLSFLPEDAPVAHSYNYVSEHLSGLYSIELAVTCPNGWLDPGAWPPLEQLTHAIARHDDAARVITPLDLLKKANQWNEGFSPEAYRLPDTSEQARALVDELPADARTELSRMVSEDGRLLRITILPRTMFADRFYDLIDAANRQLAQLPGGITGRLTGIVLLLNNAQVDLAYTQIESFAFSFAVVFLCIGIGLRSIAMIGLSIPPNLAPILAVFGLMPALGIPLDAATVLVAGVALGMSVDNTIHIIAAYQRLRNTNGDNGAHSAISLAVQTSAAVSRSVQAIHDAITELGPAMIFTTLTACIGFFTLCTSGFIPIRYFGLLAGIALLVALAADLLLTPSILYLRARLNPGATKPNVTQPTNPNPTKVAQPPNANPKKTPEPTNP